MMTRDPVQTAIGSIRPASGDTGNVSEVPGVSVFARSTVVAWVDGGSVEPPTSPVVAMGVETAVGTVFVVSNCRVSGCQVWSRVSATAVRSSRLSASVADSDLT